MPLPSAFVPRSIVDRGFWQAVAASPGTAELRKTIAHSVATAPPLAPPVPASDFLAARRRNDRSLLDVTWLWRRRTFGHLVLNRCLLGLDPADPDDRLLDWLWHLTTLPTWCVSAHLPDRDLPDLAGETLDLAACEMAAMLAETVEVLRPWIDAQSATLGDAVLNEIDRKAIRRYEQNPASWHWQQGERLSNWAGVCAGSLLTAARSLAAQGRPRPVTEAAAIDVLGRFLRYGFTAAGECDEGLLYWTYGLSVAALGWSRLTPDELRTHVDFDRLAHVADYPRRTHLGGDLFFSGNDSGLAIASPPGPLATWLASVCGNDWLRAWPAAAPYRALAVDAPARGRWTDPPDIAYARPGQTYRFLPTMVAAGAAEPLPDPAATDYLADQQAAIFRVATPAGTLAAVLSGGDNAERHNHNDLGHFLLALGGRLVVPDLGAPEYRADFFGPNRYTYLSASSRGHCCPLVNGYEQRAGAAARGRVLRHDASGRTLSLDLTAAYPPEARLRRWTRTMTAADDGTVTVHDDFELDGPGRVTQVVWSVDPPEPAGDAAWRLGPITLTATPTPAAGRVVTEAAADHLLREFFGSIHRVETNYAVEATLRTTMTFAVNG